MSGFLNHFRQPKMCHLSNWVLFTLKGIQQKQCYMESIVPRQFSEAQPPVIVGIINLHLKDQRQQNDWHSIICVEQWEIFLLILSAYTDYAVCRSIYSSKTRVDTWITCTNYRLSIFIQFHWRNLFCSRCSE